MLAISKGGQGDLFIKKAPASTVIDLTQALLNIFESTLKINIVGVRAGEKIHEALATQQELARAEDLGTHFRIRPETSLGYENFIDQGTIKHADNDYTSENTQRLTVKEVEKLLLSLDYIKNELKNHKK
jgi:UDP-glucose 4-epimerase